MKFLGFWSGIGLLTFFILWFLPWRFQTNDDLIMMWLVSGAYTGEPESYAVFIHPGLSLVFSLLYQAFPMVEWYAITWFSVLYGSFYAIVTILSYLQQSQAWKNTVTLFVLILFFHFGIFLQFTVVAGVAGFVGFLLLTFPFEGKKPRPFFLGYLLVFLSILIRWESFVLIGTGWFVCQLFFLDKFPEQQIFRRLVIVLFLFSFLFIWKLGFERYSDYSEFVTYSKARAGVSDHPVFVQLIKSKEIVPPEPWFFFGQWMMDEDAISVNDLVLKKKELDQRLFSWSQLKSGLYRLKGVIAAEVFKSSFVIILLLVFFRSFFFSRSAWAFAFLWLGFMLVFNHFFILNGRVLILFFLPFLYPILTKGKEFGANRFPYLVFSSILVVLFLGHFFNFLKEAKGRMIMSREFVALGHEIPQGNLIFIEGYKENYLTQKFTLDHPVPFLSFGWISKSPFQEKALKRLGSAQFAGNSSYYLYGVDVHEEFFLPEYLQSIGKNFYLKDRKELDNFILFHYRKSLK